MARFVVKHDMVPPGWARINAKGDKVAFGGKEKASDFASAEEALAAFEAAAQKMQDAALAAEAKAIAGGAKRERDYMGRPKSLAGIPSWLEVRMGRRPSKWGSGATGRFCAEAVGLDNEAGAPFELFYARSERGWLGLPRLKSSFGGADWRDDMSEARAFMSQEALEAALMSAPRAQEVSRFTAKAVFAVARLASGADELSQGISAACEARAIESGLEKEREPEPIKAKTGPGRGRI